MKRIFILLAIMFLCGVMCGAILLMHPRCRAFVSRVVHKIERVLTADGAPKRVDYDDSRYAAMFNDKNNLHLSIARKVGLKSPLKTRDEADKVKSGLVKIKSCDNYTVDRLTHSIPYLTPGAAELLNTIGGEFLAALESKGIEAHRIVVTSLLRTQEDVQRLRSSGNVNASSNSAHCHATTFDITYVRFDKVGFRGRTPSDAELTETLSEVLHKLQREKRCYVKYEIQQRCFHITSRM